MIVVDEKRLYHLLAKVDWLEVTGDRLQEIIDDCQVKDMVMMPKNVYVLLIQGKSPPYDEWKQRETE